MTLLPREAPRPFGPRAADDLPGVEMSVTVVRTAEELRAHLPAWQRLVNTALEPNVFFEPCLLLPAMEHLAADSPLEIVLVYAPLNKNPAAPPILCGLFPFERVRRTHGLPLSHLQSWKCIHCFLGTPLVRADRPEETLNALLDWLSGPEGSPLVKLRWLAGEGPFQQLLTEVLHRRGALSWISERFARALFRPAASFEDYMQEFVERKRRHETRRLEKRLQEQGPTELVQLQPGDDLEAWLDDFLRLESQGWKGREATSLASSPNNENFFRQACREAFAGGQLMLLALKLAGRPIAMKCNFLAADGGFAFKIAFDEELAKFSPGVLLEVHNLEKLHQNPQLAWMDSCADPDHPMINRLWPERRTMQSQWISSGRRLGDLLLSVLPLLKGLQQTLKRRKPRPDSKPREEKS